MIKILLVASDDGRDRLRLALERLEAGGEAVRIIEAPEGTAALALALKERPDVVVVEVGVHPYGGFGLTRDLKSSPELTCPVILVLERQQDEWLGRWCGADALVSAPPDPFALAQVTRQLVEESRAARPRDLAPQPSRR